MKIATTPPLRDHKCATAPVNIQYITIASTSLNNAIDAALGCANRAMTATVGFTALISGIVDMRIRTGLAADMQFAV